METRISSPVFRFSKSGVEVVQLVFHKVPDDSKVQLRMRTPFLEHYLLFMFLGCLSSGNMLFFNTNGRIILLLLGQ